MTLNIDSEKLELEEIRYQRLEGERRRGIRRFCWIAVPMTAFAVLGISVMIVGKGLEGLSALGGTIWMLGWFYWFAIVGHDVVSFLTWKDAKTANRKERIELKKTRSKRIKDLEFDRKFKSDPEFRRIVIEAMKEYQERRE